MLGLLFLPTLLMSLCVTPRVLECLSLAFALGTTLTLTLTLALTPTLAPPYSSPSPSLPPSPSPPGIKTKEHDGVLDTMMAKLEHEGDYAQASQVS